MVSRSVGSRFVTADTASYAVDLIAPMIEMARRDPRIVGSGFLYLVVMDPGLSPSEAEFEQAILHERSFGDEAGWDADYRRFARDKARLSWLRGADAHLLQSLSPHRLREGDSLLWGSVCIDGIVVGASGAFPCFDEMFAGAVALAVKALTKAARAAEG